MGILEQLQSQSTQEIEEFCTQRFQSNLAFFSSQSPQIFEHLKHPAKDYQLCLNHEGINILHTPSQSLLFPIQNNQSLMLQIHQNCSQTPLLNEKWKHYYGTDLHFMDEQFPFSSYLVNNILEFTINQGGISACHLPSSYLPSLSIFGLGGGIFLQLLAEEYESIHSFMIFEESFDLFRISCFFVDYALLFSKTQKNAGYLFIQSLIKKDYVNHFFLSRKINACVLRLELSFYPSKLNQSAQNLTHELHYQNLRCWGTYEDEIKGIKNKQAHSTSPMLIEPKRINCPICVVANGASLDTLLPFIKANQEKMIIFSAGTALKPLLHAGIKPDFQIEIERHDYLEAVLKDAPLDDIPLLCASVLDKKAKELAKELYMFERDGSSAAWLNAPRFKVQFTAPLVGNAAGALAAYLGSDVILCGLDCGFKKGANKHAKNSFYTQEDQEEEDQEFDELDSYLVNGNFSQDIYSNSLYSLSKESLEQAFSALKPFNIINLSDGAYIHGARPTKPNEFDLQSINKQKSIAQLKSLFKDPKQEHFYTKDSNLHFFEAKAFKNRIGDLFAKQVSNKKELLLRVDKIYEEATKAAQQNPFIGILFGGTLNHFLYALTLSAMHLPHDDMAPIWNQACTLYNDGFERMITDLQNTLL